LAPDDFHQEGYFEAYIKYIEDSRRARATGEDLKQVDFQLSTFEDDGLGKPDDTAPLDGEAAAPKGDDGTNAANEGNDDEDPAI